MDNLKRLIGYAIGSGQINPLEKETMKLLKELGYDFSPYLFSGTPENPQPPTPEDSKEED